MCGPGTVVFRRFVDMKLQLPLAKVDTTILEALCPKGTTDAHGEWTVVFRRFVDMKLQLPHFQEGFGVTSNAGSAISAFYAAFVSLVQWLGFCSHAEQNFIDLARSFTARKQ